VILNNLLRWVISGKFALVGLPGFLNVLAAVNFEEKNFKAPRDSIMGIALNGFEIYRTIA